MNLKTGATPMLRTVFILDLLKERLGSDYKTAQMFETRPSHISQIRRGGTVISDTFGLKAAKALDMPEEYILLSLAAERAMNSESMQEIMKLAEKYMPENMPDFDDSSNDDQPKTGT